jgi:hypothetical protein
MTIAAHYITRLPEVKVSNLTQLEWTVDQAHKEYLQAKGNTIAAWKMFDDAIEDGADIETKNEISELAEFCEFVEKQTWHEWDEAKKQLLAHYQ